MREFLKGLDLDKETIDTIMAEHGKLLTSAKESVENLKAQLAEANTSIESFKGMDIDGIKAAADEWKTKYEQAEQNHAAKLADIDFNGLLDAAITEAKGRNAKALRGLLDVDTLKASKNQADDIKAAISALQETDGYLFDTGTPSGYAGGTGGTPIGGDPGISAIRAAAGLKD